MDTQGNVYISSYSDVGNTLKEFDSDGNYLATILRDGVGGDPTDYWAPVSLATDSNDNVYALDTYGDGDSAVVRKFDSAGNLLATIDTGTNMSAGLAVDADGNVYVGDDRNNVIRVFAPSAEEDTTAPTCEFSFDGTAGDNGWYTSAGDAVVSATDDEGGSGVASIHCAVDGIEQPAVDIVPPVGGPVTAGFSISTEGKHTVTYWAVDAAGNESEHQPADVWIDTIAPAGTFAINGGAMTTHSTSVTGDSAVTDANGVEMNFSVDGESWTGWLPYAASEPLTLPAGDGTKMVDAEYRDLAGNELDLSDTIVLDTSIPTDVTPPQVTIDSPQAGATYPSYPALQPLMLSFSADDEVGELAQISVCGTLPSPGPTGTPRRCPWRSARRPPTPRADLCRPPPRVTTRSPSRPATSPATSPPPPSLTAWRVGGQACWACRPTRTVTATPRSTPTPRRTH